MRLRTDERGVTVQVGTVLLFAVFIVLISTYQATVIPQQNEQVEFNHNEQVQGQLQDLRDELHRAAVTRSGGSTSVALGTRYPVRAVFVNPPQPAGTLQTTPAANVTVENATATGETGDYWTGSARNFSTRGLVYEPIYNVYQDPPTTIYDNGVLYNQFESTNQSLAKQHLVRGNRISLVALNGSFSQSRSASATVDFEAISPVTRTVTVRNETDNLSVVVPTARPASEWEELLAEELNQSRGDDRYVLDVEDGPRPNTVRIVLEPGVYELELAKVGVGSDASDVESHYVTGVRGDNATVEEGSNQEVVLEVRDSYNNPVSGVEVNASTSLSNSSVAPTTTTSNADGRVRLTYSAPDNVTGSASIEDQINVSYEVDPATVSSFDGGARQNLTASVTVRNTDRSGLDDGTNINPSREGAVIVQNEQLNKKDDEITFEFNNTGARRNVTAARINFYYSEQGDAPETAEIRGPDGTPRTDEPLTVGGRFRSLNASGGPITLANESVTDVEFAFANGKMKEGDYVVITVIFDDGESSATYFIAPQKS